MLEDAEGLSEEVTNILQTIADGDFPQALSLQETDESTTTTINQDDFRDWWNS